MPERKPGPSVKDPKQYEALRRQGSSKEKAARIANASAGSSRASTGRRGGRSARYEDWSKEHLYERAKQVGIDGRSRMSKRDSSTPCATIETAQFRSTSRPRMIRVQVADVPTMYRCWRVAPRGVLPTPSQGSAVSTPVGQLDPTRRRPYPSGRQPVSAARADAAKP
ncbi:MAG: DUF7218 family protein [Acidimicrobiales bacterium]